METADVFGSSTAPLTWHDFLERMRQPSAADFVKAIKSFIVSFLNNSPDPERDSAAVQEFFSSMDAKFRAHPLWAGCSEEELESAGEGLEKYVMTKLFTRVFASLPDDVKVDDQLHEKMALIQQFIRPENLDIKPTFQNEASWLLAQKELQKINMYKAPRDKLVCILNCCKVINNLLLNASSEEDPPGADDFLPVLIYVTIKANPPQFHSNLLYIQRYRRQTRLVAETAYFFTNMLSAESFILNIDAKALSMDETEFEQNIDSAQAVLSGLSGESDNPTSQGHQDGGYPPKAERFDTKQAMNSRKHQGSPAQASFTVGSSDSKSRDSESLAKDQESLNKVPSISDLENKGATLLTKEEKVNEIFQEFPYFYSQSGDLTIGDVEDLLTNYKRLVFKYACLSKGLGVPTPSPPLSMTPAQSQHSSETMDESESAGVSKSTDEVDKGQKNTADDSNEERNNTDDDSNEVSSSRVESESKLEDEAVPAQGDEVSKDN